MSHTFKKRQISFESFYDNYIMNYPKDEKLKSMRVNYYTKTDVWNNCKKRPPKYFRSMINHKRRSKDFMELQKELCIENYIGNFSFWNGKDNDQWGYF